MAYLLKGILDFLYYLFGFFSHKKTPPFSDASLSFYQLLRFITQIFYFVKVL